MPDGSPAVHMRSLATPVKHLDRRVPILDHTAFPHLLSAILDAAPPASLLALRATSRALKTAADARLARRLVSTGALRTPDLALRIPPTLFEHTRVLELHGAALEAAHEHGGIPCTGCGVRQRDAVVAALLAAAPHFSALQVVRVTGSLECEWAQAAEFKRLRTAWAVYDQPEHDPLVLGAQRVLLCFRRWVEPAALSRFSGNVCLYLPGIEGGDVDALEDILDAVAAVVFSWRPVASFTFVGAERWPGGFGPEGVRHLLAGRSSMGGPQTACRARNLVRFASLDEFRALAGEDVFGLLK